MPSHVSTANWPDVLQKLCADFPLLDFGAAPDGVHCLDDVAELLEQAHELTAHEATEALLDWQLTYTPPHTLQHAA
ncbi:hypothetical protein N9O61_03085 [Octadecabacter sp.]|nr:hypothetical protein [Octadecabacter sp.]